MIKMIVLLLVPLFLSSCAQLSTEKPHFQTISSTARQSELSRLTNWVIAGSLSVQHDNQTEIVRYQWQEFGSRQYRIQLISAMGLYTAWINGQLGSVTFWKNGTLVTTAKTPEMLMQKALGWQLPITQLRYWIKGMKAPQKNGDVMVHYDQFGHLIELHQLGWVHGHCSICSACKQ